MRWTANHLMHKVKGISTHIKERNRPRQINVITSNFEEKVVRKSCIKRYQFHEPLCDCLAERRQLISSHDQLDGITIIPHRKVNSSFFFVSQDARTNREAVARDTLAAERVIKSQLSNGQDYELRAAMCMLGQNPNGFVCVTSRSQNVVAEVRDTAREAAKKVKIRHSDHAQDNIVLFQTQLFELKRHRTRSQGRDAKRLYRVIKEQGTTFRMTHAEDPESVQIELGHHLVSLIMLKKQVVRETKEEPMYWLVLLWDKTVDPNRVQLMLDLPGGKRELGESSLQCAIRETYEECSLRWDESWVRERIPGNDGCNIYFMLSPPESKVDIVEGIQELRI